MSKKINSDFGGKMQPQAIDLEESVLGCCLLEKSALESIIDILHSECFYKEVNQKIFGAILSLWNKSQPADILTVVSQLKKDGNLDFVGGAYHVSQLTNRVASTQNVKSYALIVLEKFVKRELIRTSSNTIEDSYNDEKDVFDLIDETNKIIGQTTSLLIQSNIVDSGTLAIATDKRNEMLLKSGGVTGTPSGFADLDKVTNGWQNSDLIILAARPSMGKTALATQLLMNPSIMKGKPTAIFSLEMSNEQLYIRMKAQKSGIDLSKFTKKGLQQNDKDECDRLCKELYHAQIFFDDTGGINIFELKNKARKLKREKKIELLVIDYLQLISIKGHKGNREQEISTISRELKALAKELDIPIICLSQLSRECEKRTDKKPMLSDLRESGAIEQDADLVMFLYRPEYYGITEDGVGNSTQGKALVIVSKHRNGSCGEVLINWDGSKTRFSDINSVENNTPIEINPLSPNTDFDNQPF